MSSDQGMQEHDGLVKRTWVHMFQHGEESAPPPPMSTFEMREQIRAKCIGAPAEDLPRGAALEAMDALQRFELGQKALVDWRSLERVRSDPRIALWQGDITSLRIGGIVNAANERGLGCFQPSHRCIDNVIHCAAGPALRAACAEELGKSGLGYLPTGHAMVTPGFNLPAGRVLHTPGPVGERPELLARCYSSVLECCREHGVRTVAFCCISTGLFGYPADRAAAVATRTVRDWLDEHAGAMELVVFNVFLGSDLHIYQKLLGA